MSFKTIYIIQLTLSYELDDIYVTDASTASSTIKDVEGGS